MNTTSFEISVLSELISYLSANDIRPSKLVRSIVRPNIDHESIIALATQISYTKQPAIAFITLKDFMDHGLLSEQRGLQIILDGIGEFVEADGHVMGQAVDVASLIQFLDDKKQYFIDSAYRYRTGAIRSAITFIYAEVEDKFGEGSKRLPELEQIFANDAHNLSDPKTFLYYASRINKKGILFTVNLSKKKFEVWNDNSYTDKYNFKTNLITGSWSGNPNNPQPYTDDPSKQDHRFQSIFNNPQLYKYPASDEHSGYQLFILVDTHPDTSMMKERLPDSPSTQKVPNATYEVVGVHYIHF